MRIIFARYCAACFPIRGDWCVFVGFFFFLARTHAARRRDYHCKRGSYEMIRCTIFKKKKKWYVVCFFFRFFFCVFFFCLFYRRASPMHLPACFELHTHARSFIFDSRGSVAISKQWPPSCNKRWKRFAVWCRRLCKLQLVFFFSFFFSPWGLPLVFGKKKKRSLGSKEQNVVLVRAWRV